MKKIILPVIFMIAIGLLLTSFQNQDGPDPEIVRRGVEIKIDQFRKRQIRECNERALDRAVFLTDSLMAAQALFTKRDTMIKPVRATKPIKPKFAPVPDSIEVKPVIQ